MNFKLVPGPTFYPGRTLTHRTMGDTHPVLDTGVDLYGEHRVYLSHSESMAVARAWGCLPAEEADALRARVAELEAELKDAKALVKLCQPLLDAAVEAGIALEAEAVGS